jgi:hypothetical protein
MARAGTSGLSRKRKRWPILAVGLLGALAMMGIVGTARLWRPNGRRPPQRLDLLYAAWNEFNAQRYDQASTILDRRAAATRPTALDWMLRARIAESQGHLPEALAHLKLVEDSDPIASQAWLKAGQIERSRHAARGAESAFLHSLALNPQQIQAHRELAALYAVQRRTEECDHQFRALARLISFDHILAFAWCQNLLRVWNTDEAIEVLKNFVAYDADDRWSRLALATNLRLTRKLDQAEATLGPLPDSDPEARASRIALAIDKGEIETAQRLAQDGPSDHGRLSALRGRLALSAGDAATAAGWFRSALRSDREDVDSIHGLGMALRLAGDPRAREFLDLALNYEKFKRALQDSINTINTDSKLFFKLGECCEKIHHQTEARVWYELAIKRDPLDVEAEQALSRLDQAGPTDAAGKPG